MKYVFSTTLALALLTSAPALAEDKIDVMTQNQYLGADLDPIIAATEIDEFNFELVKALKIIAANEYLARATKLAELIADRLPELVGLQEMFVFGCMDLGPSVPGQGCDDPDIKGAFNDHLDKTTDALIDLEEPYYVAAIVNNLDLTGDLGFGFPGLPVDLDGGGPDIAVTVLDRDVILARPDVKTKKLKGDYDPLDPDSGLCGVPIPNPFKDFLGPPTLKSTESEDGCNYTIVIKQSTPIPGLDIKVQRGFVGVEATVGDKTYRFINTHLEVQEPDGTPGSGIFQSAQSFELLRTLEAVSSSGTDIVVGDINSSSDDVGIPGFIIPPYAQFVDAGYTDAWDFRPGNQPGYTCCQGIPEEEGGEPGNLLNQQSNLDERIDVIFSLDEPSRVKKARVLGAKVSDKTPPAGLGLWPSDHGSVAAELQFDE